MLHRRFHHTLFLLMLAGVTLTGLAAEAFWPAAWPAIVVCCGGALLCAILCERVALSYLRRSVGGLRRRVEALSRGQTRVGLDAHPGDDFYKLVSSIGDVARRLERASEEERRLEDELRRRERLAFLGELAASVAHEVNNPLDGIQNCARILRRALDDERSGGVARAREMLNHIDSGAERIELIVRRLLTLARENVIKPVERPVHEIVRAALQQVRDKAEQLGVELVDHAPAASARAAVDPLLLEQVFVNLFLNALDSMPAGGRLEVEVHARPAAAAPPAHQPAADQSATGPAGGAAAGQGAAVVGPAPGSTEIEIEVCDTGSGIAPDVLPHIFEPFFTTKQQGRGTGLGLPIATRIVDAHRGSIEVRSRAEGGTCFIVRLPGLPE